MKRRKTVIYLIWVLCLNEVIVNFCCGNPSTPPVESSITGDSIITKFQNAIHQQNTFSILSSIEERLRNLDNIYSMQLSQNLETKLDQYNSKLENLDNKLMRLEALVMMNLGKISENISTKNFKDDISKTDTLRKLDSIYEGTTHRLNYIERKLESNSVKIQEKFEDTFTHLNQIKTGTTKRDSDLETELSTVISAIDDLKKNYKNSEQKVINITEESLNVSKHTFNLLTKYNADTRKSMNKLHDNIIGNLQYIDNRTLKHMKISDDTNILLKQMKIELKEDFNNYANKVADMNSDMWKNTDTTEDDLRNIGDAVNSTKIELQNGVRSLMLQIGKISQKENVITSEDGYKELEQKMSTNFEKILTNQDIFLESCHRLQMDESQIESEISIMLNKLLDMLEKKLSSEVKDIKNFEKNLKNHDNRINRNIFQANQNIISLFEKSTMNTQMITSEIRKIGTDLNALFSFVQSTINEGTSPGATFTSKVLLEKLNVIETSTRNLQELLSNQKIENVSNHQIYIEIQKVHKNLIVAIEKLQNDTRDFKQNTSVQILGDIMKNMKTQTTTSTVPTPIAYPEINETIRKRIEEVFGTKPNQSEQTIKKKCNDGRNLIDIRASSNDDCVETPRSQNIKKKPRKRKMKYDIDIRSGLHSNENITIDNNNDDDYEETPTTETNEENSTQKGTL